MAAGSFTFYNSGKLKISNATIDLDGDTFNAMMLTSAYTPNVATQTNLTDIVASEVSDADYSRQTLATVTVTETGGTVSWNSADISYGSAVTITAKYLALFSTTASNDLVCYVDLDTGGGSVSSSNSTFQVSINANGIATIS